MKTAENLMHRFRPDPTFEAKYKQCRHDQANQPGTPCFGFPKPRLRVTVSALDGLEVTVHTAFRKAGLVGKVPDALFAVITNQVENDNALGPQSHIGRSSEEKWNSCSNSLSQSTEPMPDC